MKSFTKVALLAAMLSTVAVPVCSAMEFDSVESDFSSESTGWGSFFLDIVKDNPVLALTIAGVVTVTSVIVAKARGSKAKNVKSGKTVEAVELSKVEVANIFNTQVMLNEAARLYKNKSNKARAWKTFLKTAAITEEQYEKFIA